MQILAISINKAWEVGRFTMPLIINVSVKEISPMTESIIQHNCTKNQQTKVKRKNEIAGQKFGRLTAMTSLKRPGNYHYYWECVCECGSTVVVRNDTLKGGHANSCGCLARELRKISGIRHGYCSNGVVNGNRTYVSWKSMKQRCYDPNSEHYKHYGKLGVTICNEWLSYDGFKNFVRDMGERPLNMTLDRINPFGNYEPSNCRWADIFVQNNNTRKKFAKCKNKKGKEIQIYD